MKTLRIRAAIAWWLHAMIVANVAMAGEAPRAATNRWDVAPPMRLLDRADVLPNSPALVKSLGDAAEYVLRWAPPADASEWQRRRPEVESAFRRAIGLQRLPPRTALNPRVLGRHEFDGYSVENVVFESRPGFPVTANLYRPTASPSSKRPAVVSPIGHFLSAGKTATDVQARCIQLARFGFVVLTYDAIGQGERMVVGNIHHDAGYALLPLGETIAGWMVWDSMRAVDYLLTLDDVDPHRIGITGNSGGGLNSLYTAALDDRLRASVVVGFTFEFNNWIKYAGAHCTCTHLPGEFRGMEWFEIAGLIAPRAVLMIQGANDGIFPVSGARRSGANVQRIYRLLEANERARFVELAGQPHAYTRPFREPMYGWMTRHLQDGAEDVPRQEGNIQTLPEKDPRLLCDPDRAFMPGAPTVVDLARRRALERIGELSDVNRMAVSRESLREWVRALGAPPESLPSSLFARSYGRDKIPGGSLERVSFNSEDGQTIPGLLWLPGQVSGRVPVVLVADGRGKGAVAESGLIAPLLAAGWAVLAVDLRGRGETLDRYGPNYDLNFRLVANQVLAGQPLVGRRAFDLRRAVDYLGTRSELSLDRLTLLGLGEDMLPALIAAVTDGRIGGAAFSGGIHSFLSQMRARTPPSPASMGDAWNDPQLNGRLDTGDAQVDFGSVIPSVLDFGDVPDLAALLAPRRVLFCQMRDQGAPDRDVLASRFERVVQPDASRVKYLPDRSLDAVFLLEWLEQDGSFP